MPKYSLLLASAVLFVATQMFAQVERMEMIGAFRITCPPEEIFQLKLVGGGEGTLIVNVLGGLPRSKSNDASALPMTARFCPDEGECKESQGTIIFDTVSIEEVTGAFTVKIPRAGMWNVHFRAKYMEKQVPKCL
ncbi:hypothetical protein [Candidatus Korobacter versatilis]|uniref:hypothetical protein n=1 Tax=Candidatus Korobacter versatilis TaxID=658062 RepID=UPI0005A4AAAE|nr:hypothetical protein [Candidatus Koribacter versatilis]